jgi:hypothetical protein
LQSETIVETALASVRRFVATGRHLRSRYWNDFKAFDAGEIIRIAGVDGKTVRDRGRRNHRVIRAGVHLSTCPTQRSGHSTKGPCSLGVERQRVEVGLGLLKVCLTPFTLRVSDATSGPTESSASVTAVISGSGGKELASVSRDNRITVLVSNTPRPR